MPKTCSMNFKFMFVGRPVPEKGIDDLYNALDELGDYQWSLSVVGLFQSDWIHNFKENHPFTFKRTRWIGSVRNSSIIPLMRSHDAVIVPSRYDNFCNVALEAMAAGRPVIGSKCGGIPDLIEHGNTGFLFEPRNVGALAQCLRNLIEQPILAKILGANGHAKATQYTWFRVAEKTEEVFLKEIRKHC